MLVQACRVGFGAVLALIALALQLAISPLVAPDSYQLFLGAVAVSVIRGGFRSGLFTLVLATVFKYAFFLSPRHADLQPHVLAARLALFAATGLAVCLIGGRLHASEARLAAALEKVKLLSGLLPICAACKRIRNPDNNWSEVETYIGMHSEANFTHSLCPNCAKTLYPDLDLQRKSGGE